MRKLALLALALLCVSSTACSRSPVDPPVNGTLEVYVFWQGQGLPDRQVEIVELDLVKKTDAQGIAVFQLAPGRYTLRAFINRGGPAGQYDQQVTVPARTVRVEIADCLPCV